MTPQEWEQIQHFVPQEFECPCCGRGADKMVRETVGALDSARDDAGFPLLVTSGYRCPDHNAEVGGVSSSSHMRGYAVDIACEGSRSRHKIVTALLNNGFNRIGIGADFIHADRDPSKPRNVMWIY